MKNPGKIEYWNFAGRQPLLPLDINLLAGEVTLVFRVIGHLLGDFGGNVGQFRQPGGQVGPLDFGPPQQLGQRHPLPAAVFDELLHPGDLARFRCNLRQRSPPASPSA